MRLYEIDITSLWWVAAEDEVEAMNIMRDELWNMEISDGEMDQAMDELTIKELSQEEAETISVISSCETSMESLWSLFETMFEAGLVHSDYHKDEVGEELDYDEEGALPGDWY